MNNANAQTNDTLVNEVKFNGKSFTSKMKLSQEMATYWHLSLNKMNEKVYKLVCSNPTIIEEIEELRANNQYDIALLKFLNHLNPTISKTLKHVIEDDIVNSKNDSLTLTGKLKYRGGEMIPASVFIPDAIFIDKLPTEGDIVYTKNKEAITIGNQLGDGGEGIVYACSKPDQVVKLIKPIKNMIRKYTQKKLEQMCEVKLDNPSIIWPLDTIYDSNGNFVGFTMSIIKGIDLKRFTSSIVKNVNDNSEEINIHDIDKKELCNLILSILDTMIYLHDKNIIIGDIKLENFMLKDGDISKVYFIDTDSYQIGDFPCLLVSPGFIPPEIDAANLGKQNCRYRTFGNENFALFSLIFHLVFRAKPPYSQQIHSDEYVSETYRVTNGMFPYFLSKEETQHHAPKGTEEPIWSHLPGYVKEAFISVGHVDGKHFGEENRLGPREWRHIFQSYLDDLNSSRLNMVDPICNQYFYTKPESIEYVIVDFQVNKQYIDTSLSVKDVIIQRFRNNSYITNMLKHQRIGSHDFKYAMFNNKMFNDKLLLSLDLIRNWNIAVEFVRKQNLYMFGVDQDTIREINSNKQNRHYNLALFNFIRALNKDIFLTYEGLIFNSLDEYASYLNEYYYYVDKSILPYEIIKEVIKSEATLSKISKIYSRKVVGAVEVDQLCNLITSNNIYAEGNTYKNFKDYVESIFEEELEVNPKNLLSNPDIADHLFNKFKCKIATYNFKNKADYYKLAYNELGYIPFRFQNTIFKSVVDLANYVNVPNDANFKFINVGRWINKGLIKTYLEVQLSKPTPNANLDLYNILAKNKMGDWEAGCLFYMLYNKNPKYILKDNTNFDTILGLLETVYNTNDVESFSKKLYENKLFEVWATINNYNFN